MCGLLSGENDANVATVDFQNAFDDVDNPVENNNAENSRFNKMLRDVPRGSIRTK